MLPFLLAIVVLAVGSFDVQASTKQLTVTVQVGYSNTIKLSQWMPVIVNITNSGPPLEGTLEIQAPNSFSGKGGPPGGSTAVYESPISLATGSTKHFRSYVLEDQAGPISIQVVQNGRVVDSEQASVAAAPSGLLAAVLSDQPSALDALAGIHPGGPGPSVIHFAAADLPDSALLLRAFDLVAIDDFSTDTLTTAQRNALVDYAMNGGSLLIGTGGSWHKTIASLPSSILPMQLTGSAALGQSTALGGLTGVEVATGTLAGATTWLSEGDKPLLVEKSVGQGYVSLATFDWNQDLITGWSGTPALLRQVFVRSVSGLGGSQSSGFGGPGIGSVSAKGGTISQALGSLPSLNLPGWWLVGALIVAYVALVGPVNYFVLRKINRRALAWLTVPVIVIVSSAGAYGASVLMKGRSAQANEVSIIHTIPGWNRAYAEEYTGILTPTRGDFNVSISGAPTLVSPIYYYNGGFGTSQPGVQVDTTTGSIKLPGMTAFTMRGFATEQITTAPDMEVDAHLLNGLLVGTVKNLSAASYTDGVVIAGNSFQKFGALGPGVTVNFSFAPTVANFNGMPAFMTIYPNSLYGQGMQSASTSDGEREAEAKTAILSTLPINGSSGITASAMPTVVAWSRQSSEVLTIDGSRPRLYAENAVVTTAAVSQIGRGALPAGVVPARLVDLEGDMQAQGGPPGLTILQSGSLTYDMAPELAPGTHLDSVSISSSNQFGGKGIASGAPGTINGQVWDWSRGAWVDLAYKDGGNTSVPEGAVNPTTGEVRLKLTSGGPFSSGWLSLAGTVS